MRAVAEKPRDAVVKFNTYRDVQRHFAVLPAIARLLFSVSSTSASTGNKLQSEEINLSFVLTKDVGEDNRMEG